MSACLSDHCGFRRHHGGEAADVTAAAENKTRVTFIRADCTAQLICSAPYRKVFTSRDVYLHLLGEDGIYIKERQ